jgi:HSP20 family protein
MFQDVRKIRHPSAQPTTDLEPYHWMTWDPFREMAPYWSRETNPTRFAPEFEVRETKDGFVFKADVPGIKEEDIEISMTGNRLTIAGKREHEEIVDADTYYARECRYGSFRRSFTLPDGTGSGTAPKADLHLGVLTFVLPKAPQQQTKRIEVKATSKPKA